MPPFTFRRFWEHLTAHVCVCPRPGEATQRWTVVAGAVWAVLEPEDEVGILDNIVKTAGRLDGTRVTENTLVRSSLNIFAVTRSAEKSRNSEN